jgi:hypothetical protein
LQRAVEAGKINGLIEDSDTYKAPTMENIELDYRMLRKCSAYAILVLLMGF